MKAEIKNTEQMQQVANLFSRLSVINAELEAIEKICTDAEDPEVSTVMSIELRKKIQGKPPINLNGDADDMQPVILVQPNPMGGGFPPQFQGMIAEQIQRQKQFNVERFDYALSDIITLRVMGVIANELKEERQRIFTELNKYNIVINGI